jgi:hypothetical protein
MDNGSKDERRKETASAFVAVTVVSVAVVVAVA